MADLRHELRSYIVENYLFGRGDDLKDTDSFWELGLMDSTGVLELISYLEEKYSVSLESGEIVPENLDSVEKLTIFMSRKLEQVVASQQEAGRPAYSQGVRR